MYYKYICTYYSRVWLLLVLLLLHRRINEQLVGGGPAQLGWFLCSLPPSLLSSSSPPFSVLVSPSLPSRQQN